MTPSTPVNSFILAVSLLAFVFAACDDEAEEAGETPDEETAEEVVEIDPAAAAAFIEAQERFLEDVSLGYGTDAAAVFCSRVGEDEREAFSTAVDEGALLLVTTQELSGPTFSEDDGVLKGVIELEYTVIDDGGERAGIESLEFARSAEGWRLTAVPFME